MTLHKVGETPEEYRKACVEHYCEIHPDRVLQSKRGSLQRLKMDILSHYSLSEEPECIRCGVDDIDVLCIDHINGGGNQHKKTIKVSGSSFYGWLKRNNYPLGYQVLCANCNLKKRLEDQREKDARIICGNNSN